jgi:hypothetical protein
MAQANPAKMNSINLVGIGPLPSNHDSENSFREGGKLSHLKISLKKPQIILAI